MLIHLIDKVTGFNFETLTSCSFKYSAQIQWYLKDKRVSYKLIWGNICWMYGIVRSPWSKFNNTFLHCPQGRPFHTCDSKWGFTTLVKILDVQLFTVRIGKFVFSSDSYPVKLIPCFSEFLAVLAIYCFAKVSGLLLWIKTTFYYHEDYIQLTPNK